MSKGQGGGFFTLGVEPTTYKLPHKKLGRPVILVVRRVVIAALEELRVAGFPLATAKEDEVTQALKSVIENKFRKNGTIPGFSRRTYEPVVRQGQVANFDGRLIAKTPDLFFKLRNDDSFDTAIAEHDGLFVECKPVDKSHSVGARYCDDGLIRFVVGDYGWAMQEGMMLAYVRDGRTISKHLLPAMLLATRSTSLNVTSQPSAWKVRELPAPVGAEPIHVSTHRRTFNWPGGHGSACPITIYHSWHFCD